MISVIKQYLKYWKKNKIFKKQGSIVKTVNIGEDVKLGKNCLINKRVILGDNSEIGDWTYLNSNKCWITVESNVKIGKFCSIAPGVHIGAGNHDYHYVTTHPLLFNSYYEKKMKLPLNLQRQNGLKDKDVSTIIKNDVWIGLNAIIKRGIVIGNGAVIAAGSVVTKDVPDYAIVGGNPAKIIKYRTNQEVINDLKKYEQNAWWNWSKDKLVENFDCLYDFEKYQDKLKEGDNI